MPTKGISARVRVAIATAAAVVVSAGILGIQPARGTASPGTDAPPDALGTTVQRILADAGFSGAAIGVKDGAVVYRGAMGMADEAAGIPNRPETRFKLGSIDKQMPAGYILTMAQDGIIDVDGSLCQGIEACPASLQDVTYHQILTQTSGVPDVPDEQIASIDSNESALRVIGDLPRLLWPGEGWAYSSTAFSLLTATPELLLGDGRLTELRHEKVFGPARMLDTGLAGFDGPVPDAAVGYDRPGGTPVGGTVGNWSTVDDLVAWHRALLAGSPITFAMVKAMETPWAQVDATTRYGYGVELRDELGHREVRHRGGTPGFVDWLVRFPDDDAMIAILSNVESSDADGLRVRLVEALLSSD
jgi:CubicO group peptidase (beta-lactamase class C family)